MATWLVSAFYKGRTDSMVLELPNNFDMAAEARTNYAQLRSILSDKARYRDRCSIDENLFWSPNTPYRIMALSKLD